MEMISQVDGRDWSAGVASYLSHLLRTHPQAFRPDAQSRQGLQAVTGGLARAGTRRESQGAAVLRRLTLDEAACCMVAAPGSAGGDFVVCSARMEELLCSSEEYTGMVNQTGVAAAYFWPRCVESSPGVDESKSIHAHVCPVRVEATTRLTFCHRSHRFVCPGSGLDELYAAMISIILDPFARPQLDVIVQVRTFTYHTTRESTSIMHIIRSCRHLTHRPNHLTFPPPVPHARRAGSALRSHRGDARHPRLRRLL